MPPESLSTLAVMKPGPSTARNSMIRIRQRFHIDSFPDSGHASSGCPPMNIPSGTSNLEPQEDVAWDRFSMAESGPWPLGWQGAVNTDEAHAETNMCVLRFQSWNSGDLCRNGARDRTPALSARHRACLRRRQSRPDGRGGGCVSQ